MLSPHEILGVAKNADENAIQEAYRAATQKWHLDKHGTATDAEQKIAAEKLREINEAYEQLTKTDEEVTQIDEEDNSPNTEKYRTGTSSFAGWMPFFKGWIPFSTGWTSFSKGWIPFSTGEKTFSTPRKTGVAVIDDAIELLRKYNITSDLLLQNLFSENQTEFLAILKLLEQADSSLINQANIDLLLKQTLAMKSLKSILNILHQRNCSLINQTNFSLLLSYVFGTLWCVNKILLLVEQVGCDLISQKIVDSLLQYASDSTHTYQLQMILERLSQLPIKLSNISLLFDDLSVVPVLDVLSKQITEISDNSLLTEELFKQLCTLKITTRHAHDVHGLLGYVHDKYPSVLTEEFLTTTLANATDAFITKCNLEYLEPVLSMDACTWSTRLLIAKKPGVCGLIQTLPFASRYLLNESNLLVLANTFNNQSNQEAITHIGRIVGLLSPRLELTDVNFQLLLENVSHAELIFGSLSIINAFYPLTNEIVADVIKKSHQYNNHELLADKVMEEIAVTKIAIIKENLKLDMGNEEHLRYWQKQTSPGLFGTGGIEIKHLEHVYRVPTRIYRMMQISLEQSKSESTYLRALDQARSTRPSFWSNPFSAATRQQATSELYAAEDLKTFKVK